MITFPVKLTFNEETNKYNKSPLRTNWQTHAGGHGNSKNYGVVIPDGVVVIDLDSYKDGACKLSDIDKQLGQKLDWEKAEVQTTASGGKHYAFTIPFGTTLTQGTNLLGLIGFDTRTSGKGWICTGEGYNLSRGKPVEDIMVQGNLPCFENYSVLVKGTTVSNEDLGDFEGMIVGDIDRVVELLAKCDPNCGYDDWLKIGMAIHSECASDEGLKLYDEWSKKGDSYDSTQCAVKWGSFKEGGGVTIGTLEYFSGNIGKLDSTEWLNDWVLLPNSWFFSLKKLSKGSTNWFNNTISSDYILPLSKNDMPIKPSAYSIGKISSVDSVAYNPKQERVFTSGHALYGNLYRDEYPQIGQCDASLAEKVITTHLRKLLKEDEASFMLDWLAHQVQKTGVLVRYCPLIIGVQGNGKTTISEFLRAAIGSSNTKVIGEGEINSTFSDWANGSAVGVIEEIRLDGKDRYSLYNRIKQFITNEQISVNRKGLPSVNVENVTNYIAFSNYDDAIPLSKDDRRFYVLNSSVTGDTDYFNNIYDCIDNNARGIREFLDAHVISELFKSTKEAPSTSAKIKMLNDTMTESDLAVKERLDLIDEYLFEDGLLSLNYLRAFEFEDESFEYKLPEGRQLNRSLKAFGWVKDGRKMIGGIRQSFYKKQ